MRKKIPSCSNSALSLTSDGKRTVLFWAAFLFSLRAVFNQSLNSSKVKSYFIFCRIIRLTFSLFANNWLWWRRCGYRGFDHLGCGNRGRGIHGRGHCVSFRFRGFILLTIWIYPSFKSLNSLKMIIGRLIQLIDLYLNFGFLA